MFEVVVRWSNWAMIPMIGLIQFIVGFYRFIMDQHHA